MYRMSIHGRARRGGCRKCQRVRRELSLAISPEGGGGCLRSGLAVVLLDGDARVLGERLLELGDALREFCLVRLDGRLDEAGLLARVRRNQ